MANEILGEARPGAIRLRSSGGMPILDEDYHFTVRSDNKLNSRLNIISTPGLPVVGQTVSAFGYTLCKSKSATRDPKAPLIWDVVCTFSSEIDERQSSQDPRTDPETWVPVYETKYERLEEVVTKDQDGKPIVNSAGQPFENGMTVPRCIPYWELYQFEAASVSDEAIIDRNETTNSDEFKGRAEDTLLLTVASSVLGYHYGALRRLTLYNVRYNRRNWKHKRLDVGTVYLGTVGEEEEGQLPYLDEGDPENDIPPGVILGGLDGSGGKTKEPAILEFRMFPQIAFGSFLRT